MKRYLLDYNLHLQCKNKLHEAVHQYFNGLHRLEVTEDKIRVLEQVIKQKIETLNSEFPRCKAITPEHFYNIGDDWIMEVNGYTFLFRLNQIFGYWKDSTI